MKFSSLLMAAIGAADARMVFFEECPKAPYANVDKEKFAGNWYELLRDSDFMFEMGHECTTHQYNLKKDGSMSLYFSAWMW